MDALARGGGWPHFSERFQLLSRYPIIDPPGGDGRYAFLEVAPGEVVAIENVHLPSNPYGPFRIMQGETREQILEREPAPAPGDRALPRSGRTADRDGHPGLLTGDFNTPSHHDWTPEMVGERHQVRYPVRWPVTVAVEEAGFVDSYRAVHPNPETHPGITWPAGRPDVPSWDPRKNAPHDRIDAIYAAGDATATARWAVVDRPRPGRRGPDDRRRWHRLDAGGSDDGTIVFDTSAVTAGSYEAVLLDAGGVERSRIAVWVAEPGAGPEISTLEPTYGVGEPIEVHWTNAQARRWDWIGIYRRDRDPYIRWYLLWTYTGATVEGTARLGKVDYGNRTWPLEPGRYSVYLLRDDSYRKVAQGEFEIVG